MTNVQQASILLVKRGDMFFVITDNKAKGIRAFAEGESAESSPYQYA